VKEAAHAGDVVVVTIPEKSISSLPADLFKDVPTTVVVIDTGNYYPQRDGRIDAIENGMPESQWVAQQLSKASSLRRRLDVLSYSEPEIPTTRSLQKRSDS
jgi:8-hydroxy-5-deazaflavin:NADPH oxidoreductase